MTEPIAESKEQIEIRQDAEKHITTLIQGMPLLGTGNTFVKDDSMSMLVMIAKGGGATDKRIAEKLGISVDTLTRHFKLELESGGAFMDEFIYDSMVMGVHRSRGGDARYNPILMRMAAHRLGISDKTQVDNISSDGTMSPALPNVIVLPDNDCDKGAQPTAPSPANKEAEPKVAKPARKPAGGKKADKKAVKGK